MSSNKRTPPHCVKELADILLHFGGGKFIYNSSNYKGCEASYHISRRFKSWWSLDTVTKHSHAKNAILLKTLRVSHCLCSPVFLNGFHTAEHCAYANPCHPFVHLHQSTADYNHNIIRGCVSDFNPSDGRGQHLRVSGRS